MFTLCFEFRKNCLEGFENVELDSVLNVLDVIKNNVECDVCFEDEIGKGYLKVKVLLRAVDIVEFIVARSGLEKNFSGRGFTKKICGVEIIDANEDITAELLLDGEIEEKEVKISKIKRVFSHLLNKGGF